MSPQRFALAALALVATGVGSHVASADRTPRVARYAVFERALIFKTSAANPWEQVKADVRLLGPGGRRIDIGGFYVGGKTWKFRFAPGALGTWRWRARIADSSHSATRSGSFLVVPGGSPGLVRTSLYNRFRWTFSDGKPYYPIGLQDCTVTVYTDNPLTGFGFDGGQGTPPRWVSLEPYLRTFGAAGFNLFRWGPNNCSFGLYDKIDPSGNIYSQQGGSDADQLLASLRRHGFRIEMVLFGFSPPFPSSAGDRARMAAVKRYVKYVVDRYGAYVDFWELMNEATVSNSWYTSIGGYLRQIDLYHHPIGTSESRPDLRVVDFGSDHWYQTEADLDSDRVAWERLRGEPARRFGKPTLVDEQGNSGRNWDATSAVRMRIRAWTAFFAEATLVFWNTSATKDYVSRAANIYLGPEERGYIHALQRYTRGFDPRARVVSVSVPGRSDIRAYGLRGPNEYGLYLVAAANHSVVKGGVRVVVNPRRAGRAKWIDPARGETLRMLKVRAGKQVLVAPPFTTDVALKILSSR
jgi:hypothetical protein